MVECQKTKDVTLSLLVKNNLFLNAVTSTICVHTVSIMNLFLVRREQCSHHDAWQWELRALHATDTPISHWVTPLSGAGLRNVRTLTMQLFFILLVILHLIHYAITSFVVFLQIQLLDCVIGTCALSTVCKLMGDPCCVVMWPHFVTTDRFQGQNYSYLVERNREGMRPRHSLVKKTTVEWYAFKLRGVAEEC